MAKRGVLEHPKTLALADALGIMDCFAVGILEVFWHWVAKYHPTGDISGTKPSIFARSIRYQGDANALWNELVSAGFIEVNGDRMIVHDWSEHADNSVHQLLKKRGQLFGDGFAPFSRTKAREAKANRESVVTAPQPEHEQNAGGSQTVCEKFTNDSRLPEPEPEPEKTISAASAAQMNALWAQFCAHYPPRNGGLLKSDGLKKFTGLVKSGTDPTEVIAGVKRYRAWADRNQKTGTEFVKQMPPWLNGKLWLEDWGSDTAVGTTEPETELRTVRDADGTPAFARYIKGTDTLYEEAA